MAATGGTEVFMVFPYPAAHGECVCMQFGSKCQAGLAGEEEALGWVRCIMWARCQWYNSSDL